MGIDISDFEIIDFSGHGTILGCSQPLGRLILNINDTYVVGQKIFKKCGMKKIFSIFRKTSKLSRNTFWACWDHIVAQKSIFQKKKVRKRHKHRTPPRLATCVISKWEVTVALTPRVGVGGVRVKNFQKVWYEKNFL